jgi:hypothetical protein
MSEHSNEQRDLPSMVRSVKDDVIQELADCRGVTRLTPERKLHSAVKLGIRQFSEI